MASNFGLPPRIASYLRRLAKEYKFNDNEKLAAVLDGSKFSVREETSYDRWNGGTYGHDVILYVPDDLIGLVPLDQQGELQEKVRTDLNKAASAFSNEFVEAVHFEYLDDLATAPSTAVDVQQAPGTAVRTVESSVWHPNAIRLFISHRDTAKKLAHDLASALKRDGISSFVAHDTIEPDEDWQLEIERALQTMDAMLAFITDDFFESAWTNQREIGFALARGVPVISLKVGSRDPVGFIRNRQAIKGNPTQMVFNASEVFDVIAKRIPNSPNVRRAVIGRFVRSVSFADAEERFKAVAQLKSITEEEVSQLVQAFNENSQVSFCWALTRENVFLNFINGVSARTFELENRKMVDQDEEIPF